LSIVDSTKFDLNAKEIFNVTFIPTEEIIISKLFDEIINYGVTVSKNAAIISIETYEAIIILEAGINHAIQGGQLSNVDTICFLLVYSHRDSSLI
jgi:hypothetical protein